MNQRHIANSIRKRRRELDAKLETIAKTSTLAGAQPKIMAALGEFMVDMDKLASRIDADEDAPVS